jgi:hypothetical protein
MCLQITLGENHGSGHFYLAKTRTFLLCVDTNSSMRRAPAETAPELAHWTSGAGNGGQLLP